jgi:hypothetical protein
VYIIPGSNESGGVPKTTLKVPPDLAAPLELDDDDDDVFDELPQAATARAEPNAMRTNKALRT